MPRKLTVRNSYECHCGTQWKHYHTCACNDLCPTCGTFNKPWETENDLDEAVTVPSIESLAPYIRRIDALEKAKDEAIGAFGIAIRNTPLELEEGFLFRISRVVEVFDKEINALKGKVSEIYGIPISDEE